MLYLLLGVRSDVRVDSLGVPYLAVNPMPCKGKELRDMNGVPVVNPDRVLLYGPRVGSTPNIVKMVVTRRGGSDDIYQVVGTWEDPQTEELLKEMGMSLEELPLVTCEESETQRQTKDEKRAARARARERARGGSGSVEPTALPSIEGEAGEAAVTAPAVTAPAEEAIAN